MLNRRGNTMSEIEFEVRAYMPYDSSAMSPSQAVEKFHKTMQDITKDVMDDKGDFVTNLDWKTISENLKKHPEITMDVRRVDYDPMFQDVKMDSFVSTGNGYLNPDTPDGAIGARDSLICELAEPYSDLILVVRHNGKESDWVPGETDQTDETKADFNAELNSSSTLTP